MNLHFVHPWVLYLIWLVPAVAAWWIVSARRRHARLAAFVSATMQNKLMPRGSHARFMWQAGIVSTGLLLLMLATARPRWGTREETVYTRGRDVMICLDVSRSMLANDVHPNRLRRAKADLLDLIKELRGDRAGLIAFRNKGSLVCPLTTDYAYLRQMLDATDIHSAPRGETSIADAIMKALDAFDNTAGAHKAIVLVSDGEDLEGKALDAAKEAGERGIPIFAVGLGSSRGARIPDQSGKTRYAQHEGEDVVTKLDNKTLHKITRQTPGGAYIPLGTASTASTTLGTLYREYLRNVTAQDLEETLKRRHIERFQIFLFPALLCFVGGAFLSRGRLAIGKPAAPVVESQPASPVEPPAVPPPLKDLSPPRQELKRLGVLLALGGLLAGSNTPGATNAVTDTNAVDIAEATDVDDVPAGRSGARIAQRLYGLGKYKEAAETYLHAATRSTAKSQSDFRFNAALSYLKAGLFEDAADIFETEATSRHGRNRDVSLGLGAALCRQAEPDEDEQPNSTNLSARASLLNAAAEAFKNAARYDGRDAVSRENLQAVLNALPEVEQSAKLARLLEKYQSTPPTKIADEMLRSQREIRKGVEATVTNNTPSQIRQYEDLAARQRTNADLWIPLKGKLMEAMQQQAATQTNVQQQLAMFEHIVEGTRENMRNAASELRDLNPDGYNAAATAEAAVYQLWKGIVPYEMVLGEDMRRQSNAIVSTASGELGDAELAELQRDQNEALALTHLFGERFQQQVPEEGIPAQGAVPGQPGTVQQPADTNQPPVLSAEDRRKVVELTAQAIETQKSAVRHLAEKNMGAALPAERESYALLEEIAKLLPKPPQQQQQQQQDRQQDRQDQQQQDRQDQQQDEQQQDQQQQQEQQEPEEKTPEEVREVLEKALEREKEHEEEKRRRQQRVFLAPGKRDW